MLNNWFKKEKPFAGFAGFGGGATGLAFAGASANGHSATGGIISDYEQGGGGEHTFLLAPGNFNVTELGQIDDTVEYLIVSWRWWRRWWTLGSYTVLVAVVVLVV